MHDMRHDDPTRRPYFPIHPQLWIADPRMQELNVEARGALMQLMCYAWISTPPCTLPDDDGKLATFSGLGRRWQKYGAQLRSFFAQADDGHLVHPGLALHFESMVTKSEAKSRAGRKGNEARWGDRSAIPVRSHEDQDAD